jgi:hypothetical protein
LDIIFIFAALFYGRTVAAWGSLAGGIGRYNLFMLAAFVLSMALALPSPSSLSLLPSQGQPVPQPFPRPGSPPVQAPPTRPAQPSPPAGAPRAPADAAPTEGTLGVPLYPGAQFITSYDAGRDQRYYLFGSAGSFVDLVTYYRTVLKQKGELVYDVPATHEFDVGKFDEKTMAFPPGVTIKEYKSEISEGYPNPKPGGQPARFPTLIQIVPVTER